MPQLSAVLLGAGIGENSSPNTVHNCPPPLCFPGIGENSAPMRREMTRDMEFAGVVLDDDKNVKVRWRACDLLALLMCLLC